MGAKVDQPDESGWTPLHIAGKLLGLPEVAGVLIRTPLVSAGHERVVIDLLGAGAEVNKPNDKGLIAL
jgi:26S proteasome non-ATPase regulatory subunit 10